MQRYMSGEAFIFENIYTDGQSDIDCNLSLEELGEQDSTYVQDQLQAEDEDENEGSYDNLMSLKDVIKPLSPSMKMKNSQISVKKQELKASRQLNFKDLDDSSAQNTYYNMFKSDFESVQQQSFQMMQKQSSRNETPYFQKNGQTSKHQ